MFVVDQLGMIGLSPWDKVRKRGAKWAIGLQAWEDGENEVDDQAYESDGEHGADDDGAISPEKDEEADTEEEKCDVHEQWNGTDHL